MTFHLFLCSYVNLSPQVAELPAFKSNGGFPVGEIQEYELEHIKARVGNEEKRALDRINSDLYEVLREASEVSDLQL